MRRDIHGTGRRVALCLQRKIGQDGAWSRSDAQLADGIAPAIAGRPAYIQLSDIRDHHPDKRRGAMLEGMRPPCELGADGLHEGKPVRVGGKLFGPGPVFQRWCRSERLAASGPPP